MALFWNGVLYAENPGTHIITIRNKLEDKSIVIEIYQQNLRASIHTPEIREKGEVVLTQVSNNEIKIAPGAETNVEVRAKGSRTKGHYIAHTQPDTNVTIRAFEIKDQNRTPQSERYPGECQLGKPGDGDEDIEITKSRTNEGLSCKKKEKPST